MNYDQPSGVVVTTTTDLSIVHSNHNGIEETFYDSLSTKNLKGGINLLASLTTHTLSVISFPLRFNNKTTKS